MTVSKQPSVTLSSIFPRLYEVGGRPLTTFLLFTAIAVFLTSSFAILYVSLRRLFFLDLATSLLDEEQTDFVELVQQRLDAQNDPRAGVFVYNLSPSNLRKLVRHVESQPCVGSPALLDFDALSADEKAPAELPKDKRIVLYSRAGAPFKRQSAEAQQRWAAALAAFPAVRPAPHVDEHLADPEVEVSAAYVAELWSSCSEQEQRVLGQLAVNGFTTPHPSLRPSIDQLARRGMLRLRTLTIAHPAVVDFVREEVSEGRFKVVDDKAVQSPWDQLKVPLMAAVAVACAALGISEPELVATGILAPTIAAGMPALLRALSRVVRV